MQHRALGAVLGRHPLHGPPVPRHLRIRERARDPDEPVALEPVAQGRAGQGWDGGESCGHGLRPFP